ncbi:Glycosyl transferases group 1 [Sphingobacterium spiritivorum]|uniref:Glycosyl transferases group 1 n=1 Tax=Sphingobacterium spiritivorum TaxID=258 RepID=A0A380BAL3_SPHSI|nr:glycosyltransferase [Sphingobacterium spiritivorum]SUI96873.1 Glycosyl transferases group 1 [Sphingobacterium spiritivorum]
MKKITFIIAQYGDKVNGGAEKHCQMLAQKMSSYYEIEVLTTCCIDYNTFEEFYSPGTECYDNICVRRFKTNKYDSDIYKMYEKKIRIFRKVRRSIYRLGLSRILPFLNPVWQSQEKTETAYYRSHGFYSSDLLTYLEEYHQQSQAIILFSYLYPSTVFGSLISPEKTILIPTAHNESHLFRPIMAKLFNHVAHIAFNTHNEQELCRSLFGRHMAPHTVIGVGTDLASPTSLEYINNKFNLPSEYIMYFGRVADSKLDQLIPYFLSYKKKYPNNLKLVLTGKLYTKKVDHKDIVYTDFVSEAEKTALIQHAKLIINPSPHESLSLLMLESMKLGKIVLVNGKSKVLKEHCIKSNGAAFYYESKQDFIYKIHELVNGNQENNSEAQKYIEENYNWDIIIQKFRSLINRISENN